MEHGYIGKIKSKIGRSKYVLYGAVLISSSLAPLIMPASTGSASATFTNYSTTSSYNLGSVTTAGGSLWYVEGTSSTPNDYIGNMTTSGTVTDYNISYPTGTSKFSIKNLTTGPDGNIWFDGCADTTGGLYSGFLNISTGAVTFYGNTHVSCNLGRSPGPITAGSDGYVWYTDDNYEGSGDNGYIFSVNPSTGTTSAGLNVGVGYIPAGLTTGSDGRLWLTIPADDEVMAYTISSGTTTGANVYHFPIGSYPTNITSGPDGNLWVLEQGVTPKKIAKVTTSGSVTAYTLASGVIPGTLAPGSDGAVWFTDSGSTKNIGRISSSGSITEYTVPGTSVGLYGGLALGPDGAMWFPYTDSGGHKLGRLGY